MVVSLLFIPFLKSYAQVDINELKYRHMKTMVITGASTGLGKVMALKFAKDGYKIRAVARSKEKLEDMANQIHGQIFTYSADVGDTSQVTNTFNKIFSEHQKIDVLINNASVFNSCNFYEEELNNVERIIDTNLKGTMFCTHAVLKSMVEQKDGHIINIASVSGTHGIPQQAIYGASKHGVVDFSDVIGQEVKEFGVHVSAICPGGIDTPLWNESNPYPGVVEDLIAPEELTDLVAFVLEKPTLYKKLIMFPMSEWH